MLLETDCLPVERPGFFENLTGWHSEVEYRPCFLVVPIWSQTMFNFCEQVVSTITLLVLAGVGVMHAVKFAVIEYHETRKAIQEAGRK